MEGIIVGRAEGPDMESILGLQIRTFEGEQEIPADDIPLPARKEPQWWCAKLGAEVVGAAAAWREQGQIHWGRFAVRPEYRGQHIGSMLARYSLEDLFSQGIEEVYMEAREATVQIVCRMGGRVIGAPSPFYVGTVTPVTIKKADFMAGCEEEKECR
jgi:ribosomal protein S18 acetylase RimI-like enzyme